MRKASEASRVNTSDTNWTEQPKGTWHRLGWSVQKGGIGWQAFAPAKAVKCASFCLLSDAKSWVDKQIAVALSAEGEAA